MRSPTPVLRMASPGTVSVPGLSRTVSCYHHRPAWRSDADPDSPTPRPVVKRSPLRSVGAKAKRERPALDAAREVVRERRWCEAGWITDLRTGTAVCGGRRVAHEGAHVHHVWPEDRDRGVHDPDRMLYLCPTSHAWAHANPSAAAEVGLLRPAAR